MIVGENADRSVDPKGAGAAEGAPYTTKPGPIARPGLACADVGGSGTRIRG